jgi:Icc-related predicted phosphoesterase
MKLHVLSDLHIEFGNFSVPDVGADLVILAGDTHVGIRGLRWILDQDLKVSVVYVLGNHEFYWSKFPDLIDKLKREVRGTNVHVLENDVAEFCGFRFFGCTLWSDMNLFGNAPVAMAAAASGMSDYHLIRNSYTYRALTPEETVIWHKNSVKKLKEFMESGDPEKSVIVTHAAPSIQSIPERYWNHQLTPAFASNMEDLIRKYQPRLWIHGHTHDSYDYQIGKTRIVCNPRGYVHNANNPGFKKGLTIEI